MSKETKALSILFFTLVLDMIGVGMILPIIPILFTDASSTSFLLHGYSAAGQFFVAGLITSLFGFMQFFAAPILGHFSDVYGRKRILILCVGILALSQILFGIGISVGSLSLLLFSRLVAGISAANFSIVQAAIADITPPEGRARNFGLIGAAFGIGAILGPVFGGFVSHSFGAASPFWFAGALGMLNALFLLLQFSETRIEDGAAQKNIIWSQGLRNIYVAATHPTLRVFFIAQFLFLAGFTFYTSFIGVFAVDRFQFSEKEVGILFAVGGLGIIVTQGVLLRVLTRYYNPRTLLLFALPLYALILSVHPFILGTTILFLATLVLTIPQGIARANMMSLLSSSAASEKQGVTMGIGGSLMALAQGVVPLCAGVFAGGVSISVPFLFGALLVLCSWILFWKYT